jgi:hypothetical protein
MDEYYELAIATMFFGGLIINYMGAHPNADVLDILNPEDTALNQLARKVLEIKGVSSNFFRLNQNISNGGSNPENDNNKENINNFMIAFNNLPPEKQEKIKKLIEIIRETFYKKNISVVGGTKKQRINKRKSTKKKWKKNK